MKKSFTLIEVMIATFLVFIISIIVLSSIENTSKLINLIQKNKLFALKSSVITNEYQKNRKNLYEYLSDFKIDNDKIINVLKKTNYNYNINSIQYSMIENFQKNELKMVIYNKHHSLNLYSVNIK